MTRVSREIIRKTGCNVVDLSLATTEAHKKDLTRRLAKQEKALVRTIEKGWMGKEIIEKSITDIKATLEVLTDEVNAA